MPFGNELVVLTLSGKEILALCDIFAKHGGEGVAGLRMVAKNGVVKSVTIAGKEVIPEVYYTIATSDYLFRKPNKRIFQFALQRAELKPEDVWYIGDQYEADVKGALGAGVMPVWYQGAIDLPFTADESVLTVQSWKQLREIMDEQGI